MGRGVVARPPDDGCDQQAAVGAVVEQPGAVIGAVAGAHRLAEPFGYGVGVGDQAGQVVGAAVKYFFVVGLCGQQVFHLVNEVVQRVFDGYHGMPPADLVVAV